MFVSCSVANSFICAQSSSGTRMERNGVAIMNLTFQAKSWPFVGAFQPVQVHCSRLLQLIDECDT